MNDVIAQEREPRFRALIPFFVFVFFYVGLSVWANDFYKVPMPAAFLVASASALLLNRRHPLNEKINVFASGMGDSNIMIMCLIFILAGAFAAVAKGMGAVDAAVLITRHLIPAGFLLSGIFLVSCLISLSIGTSCGTIAALTPIAVGLIAPLGIRPELMLGAVIGGAMFGDNLSMISDTTIAATRTQNVAMRDKFYANFFMVLPAAVLALVIYFFAGRSGAVEVGGLAPITWKHLLSVTPYLLILVLALCGLNVMALLFFGVVVSCAIGIFTGAFNLWGALDVCGKGTIGMAETLIVAILAGGLLKVIRWNGGISYLMKKISALIHSSRGCEFGIFLLVSAINLFTANNTVAIVIAGPIAKEFGGKYGCSPKRIASVLDTASCFVQGLIPYGAQILIAMGVAKSAGCIVSTLDLMGTSYYQWLMAAMVILTIFCFRRKNENREKAA
ncbi:MAG: Na+/H+ antiporter NhaC family protein [Lentisphaeria bacterium]|nr:Na+/H+ antiporter NhaC family protein [Lentisphaeria bacterium]